MQTEEISLAPAAGAGIGKILADRLLAEPDFVDSMVAALMSGLKANRSFWVKRGAESELITEPDSKVQLQAVALTLAHMEGEPVKRIIHQHLGVGGHADPLAALVESPAARDELRKLLDKAEWKTSGRKAHKKTLPKNVEDADEV